MPEVENGVVFDISGDGDGLNPGRWFDMEGGGRVCLRVCSGDDFRAIRRKTVKKRRVYKKIDGIHQSFIEEDTDEDLQSRMLNEFCIVSWENFFDAVGSPIPCNAQTKALLMGKSVRFAKFVNECLEVLRKEIEGETDADTDEEGSEKN